MCCPPHFIGNAVAKHVQLVAAQSIFHPYRAHQSSPGAAASPPHLPYKFCHLQVQLEGTNSAAACSSVGRSEGCSCRPTLQCPQALQAEGTAEVSQIPFAGHCGLVLCPLPPPPHPHPRPSLLPSFTKPIEI